MAVVEEHERRENPGSGHSLRWIEIAQGGVAGLVIVLLVAVVLFAYRGGALAAFLEPSPPDVIIIVVADALRADRLSCYTQCPADGYTANRTPHIDALARDGVLYRDMNAPAAWTKPSVATILTSLYPSTHRACGYKHILPDEVLTLPEILATRGYHTVGFVANIYLFHELNFHQGYAEYYDLDPLESSFYHKGDRCYQEAELVNWRVLPWLEANCDQGSPSGGQGSSSGGRRSPSGDKRFFMYLHYMDPHGPYFVHPYDGRSYYCTDPSMAKLQSDVYDGEIAYFDRHFGNLIATLKRLGLYDDALIVFTSDHGEEFYEHQGWAHGKTLYQEITSVPLIVKYPGNVRAGTVDEGLARSLDIAPTILDVAGVEPPAAMRGVSLRLPPDSPARAQFSFAEDFCLSKVMALRTPRYKLIEVIGGDRRGREPTQLYDLAADPGETTNLAATRPDLVARLRADMSQTLALAERAAVGGQEVDLSPAFMERLRQLGY